MKFLCAVLMLISFATLATEPCQEIDPLYDSDGSSCSAKAVMQADDELNTVYKSLLAELDAQAENGPGALDAKNEIIVAQRAWIQMRDADCAAVFSFYSSGTIRVHMLHECIIKRTKQRTSDLKSMFDGT